jgi:hypothetical protein
MNPAAEITQLVINTIPGESTVELPGEWMTTLEKFKVTLERM